MNLKTLISEDELEKRVKELGNEITEDYKDKEIDLICILKGSMIFTADLMRAIDKNVKLDFIRVVSYEGETRKDIDVMKTIIPDVNGKDVILVEDIVDSGYTMHFLIPELEKQKPNSIKVCTLLDKPEKRIKPFVADYVGFEIGDAFVLGYGLDYNQDYRNLPYVAYKDSENKKEPVKVKIPQKKSKD